MKEVHLIAIGKTKDPFWEQWVQIYQKRLVFPVLNLQELRSKTNRKEDEAKILLQKIQEISKDSSRHLILLDPRGKLKDSFEFSSWLYRLLETKNEKIIFVIGGPEGFAPSVLEMASELISLSPLTFPHHLARLILMEQIYRAQTIQLKHPYHH